MQLDFTNHKINFGQLYSERDEYCLNLIEQLLQTEQVDLKTMLHNPMSFMPRRELPQILAYYEIFKKTLSLPGSIAEIGVFMGNGLFTWAKLLETFFPGNRGKKVYGFDNFMGYGQDSSEIDLAGIRHIAARHGRDISDVFKASKNVVDVLMKVSALDNIVMGIDRAVLICTDQDKSLKDIFEQFLAENPGVRLNILVVDVNLYMPTQIALNFLNERIVHGGYIVLRGYGVKPWEGESLAVDEFLKSHTGEFDFDELFPFSMYPAAILRKA